MDKLRNISSAIIPTLFVIVAGVIIYQGGKMLTNRSTNEDLNFIDNSYHFISPLKARANGNEKIRVSINVINSRGLALSGKKVNLSNDNNLKFEVVQSISDQLGKSIIDVTSNKIGIYNLNIVIDGVILRDKVVLTFY